MLSEDRIKFRETELSTIPKDWKVLEIKDVCILKAGSAFSKKLQGKSSGYYPFIKVSDMNLPNNTKFINTANNWIEEVDAKNTRAEIHTAGAVVFAKIGIALTFNRRRILKRETIIDNNMMSATPKEKNIDASYMYFLFCTIDFNKIARGTALPFLSTNDIYLLKTAIPTLIEQRSIAKILSDLDSKIEINQQMNKTLEAIGQAVFKRWFVDFEFPNEEGKPYKASGGEMAESEFGEIPQGWTVGCLGDIADNLRKPANPRDIEPGTPYIGLEHMPRKSIALSEWGCAKDVSSNKSSFSRRDILFGKLRPYFHKVGVAPIDGVCSTDILVIAPKKPEAFGIVLFHLSSAELVNYADKTSTGTKMPRASWSDLAQYKILIPQKEVMQNFATVSSSFVERIINNVLQSRILGTIRDLLLPQLMSGKIRVPFMEKKEVS